MNYKQYTPTQITKDRLLEVEVGEEVSFIIPIDMNIDKSKGRLYISNSKGNYIHASLSDEQIDLHYINEFFQKYVDYALQQGDKFFIAEEYEEGIDDDEIASMGCAYSGEECKTLEFKHPFEVVGVKVEEYKELGVKKWEAIYLDMFASLYPMQYYNELVSQHNELNNTNIEPSLDDSVFYVTATRIK